MEIDPNFISNDANQLREVISLLKDISGQSDPQSMVAAYAEHRRKLISIDRTISISRRDLNPPYYRITRSDLWTTPINPWQEKEKLPILGGGLLGQLLYAGEAILLDEIQVSDEDPAAEHLRGMRSLAAIPHYDNGVAINMVIHLRKDAAGFARNKFPQMVLLSGLFGRATRGLVMAEELRVTSQQVKQQYLAMAELSNVILEQARELKTHALELEKRVEERTQELEAAHDDALYILATASEEKDEFTGEHLRRVHGLTASISKAIGYPNAQARQIAQAAVLHDVGKLHIPDEILKKAGPLTDEERRIMESHTLAGERILPDRPYFFAARRVARSHHENWDGSGYPDGLRGEQIPIEARIVHLVDVYDALTSVRPYKTAWTAKEAQEFVRCQRGAMFEPKLVDTFLAAG